MSDFLNNAVDETFENLENGIDGIVNDATHRIPAPPGASVEEILRIAGTTIGASAYEIACSNGFTGTEAEWVASLKPVNGVDYFTNSEKSNFSNELKNSIWSTLSETDRKIKVVAGALRNAGDGWFFIDDVNHKRINLSSVSVNATNKTIDVTYSFTAKRVISLTVTPDEGYAGMGIFCGASAGKGQANIKVFKSVNAGVGGVFTCSAYGFTPNPNNYGITSYQWNAETHALRISHDGFSSIPGWVNAAVSVTPRGNGKFIPVLKTTAINYFDLEFYNFDGTKITTLSNALDFQFTRITPNEVKKIEINPNELVAPSANLWVFGVFEVD